MAGPLHRPAHPGTRRYLSLEATASHVRVYSALAVPGLLQTAGYAAAAYQASRPDLTSDQIARLTAWHAGREESLCRDGVQVHLVIEQAALLRPLASVQVLKGQWRHLIEVASSAAVTIQVVLPAAARAVLSPAFTILSPDGRAQAQIGCCEGPGGQVLTTTRAADVRTARATFDALSRAALPPARSVELIENLTRG